MAEPKTRTVLEWRFIQLALEFPEVTSDEAAQMAKLAWATAPDIQIAMMKDREDRKKAG